MKTCPNCKNELKDTAKFCGKCGTKVDGADTAPQGDAKNLERVGDSGFIRWTMLPGQIAVKITEDEIQACGKIKGVSIQEGTRALVFVNGKLAAEVAAGNYEFKDIGSADETVQSYGRSGGFVNFLKERCARAWEVVVGSPTKAAISVVLVRATEFPLVFTIKDANTSGARSDVGLQMLCKVANINAFYQNLLLDKKFVSFEEMQRALAVVIANQVNLAVASYSPDKVRDNPALVQNLLGQLQPVVSTIYPFVLISRIIQLTADNQALEAIRKMAEELYVSEQELVQLQKRNDFLNRLQAVNNDQSLSEGRMGADFESKKLEIYKQMELTKDEQAKFDLMLAAERKIREAKSESEVEIAIQEFKKSELLREQELDQIRHQGDMVDLRNTQEYDMAELRGDLTRKRELAAFDDERRRAEIQLDKEEQQSQLDMLRQAQAIRMEREDAEHRRQMESEKQKIDAKLENQRIYAGMSVEQIMASNPDISPEAAKALASKFGADSKDELIRMREKDFQRMQEMVMGMMGAKQSEIDKARDDANRSSDRVLAGVQSAVTAAGAAFSGKSSSARLVRKDGSEEKGVIATGKCSNCGVDLEPGASFCGECGTAV